MSGLAPAALEQLRPFQRTTVERSWASLFEGQGTGRFLVADEVGLGKTRVAAALVRQIEELNHGKRSVVLYFAPNAEVARQNLRVLRAHDVESERPGRLTLLPLAGPDLRRRGLHVLGFTPGTSLSPVARGTGTAKERALLLAMLRPVWRCGTGDVVLEVLRVGSKLSNFRRAVEELDRSAIDLTIQRAFSRALACRPDFHESFKALRRSANEHGELPHGQHTSRRRLIGKLRLLLARSVLEGLKPRLVILDEFQKYPEVLRMAEDPQRLEHTLAREPVLLLSATPYRMTTDEANADSHVEVGQLLRFLFDDPLKATAAAHELDELRRGFKRLRPKADASHASSVARVRTSKDSVEQTLAPVLCRSQRPFDVASTRADPVLPTVDDIQAYLAFQRTVDIAEKSSGLRSRTTIEYWKSAPYLMAFMRDYKVKHAINDAWRSKTKRLAMQRELRSAPGASLSLRAIERFQAVAPANARYRRLSELTLEADQWRALWVPPALSPYELGGPFAQVARGAATKTLVFSGWRVVPNAVAALLGYEAERRSARGQDNSAAARKRRTSAQLLSLRFDARRGLQRGAVMALTYPSIALAGIDPYELSRTAPDLPLRRQVVAHARRLLSPAVKALVGPPASGRVDPRWYWAAPMLLDASEGVDVDDLLRSRDGLSKAWATDSEALDAALALACGVLEGSERLGRQPHDLTAVLAEIAVAGPAVTAYRTLAGDRYDRGVHLSAARIGWGMRTLLGRADAVLAVRSSSRGHSSAPDDAYWRQALRYCAQGALQGVMDEYLYLLAGEQSQAGASEGGRAARIARAFERSTDLSPLSISADGRGGKRAGQKGSSERRLTSRFAVAFGTARSEDDVSVHPELVRQAFNSPFWPWVLVTTSVGQEGLDFHRYCHQLVHWNVPATPVELEQREGRVLRFLGHAVRRNIAAEHAVSGRAVTSDRWEAMIGAARSAAVEGDGFSPEWAYLPARHSVARVAPVLAYSRDHHRLERVQRARVYYRLVLGQPDPQELVEAVMAAVPVNEARQLAGELSLDLRPKGNR